MLLCGTTNLREISLFPMNQQGVDLLMGAPSEVATKQLRELHIRLNLPDKGQALFTRWLTPDLSRL
jgi:aspartyl-tRNA synthetase